MFPYSEGALKEAYSYMDMDLHPWAKHAGEEIDFIESMLGPLSGKSILDAGCGRGRHSLEIAQRYPESNVLGMDFSESNIKKANALKENRPNLAFKTADLKVAVDGKYDLILCLYDVIGSFPEAEDNESILRNLYGSCKDNGHIVLSVMNMEYTLANAKEEYVGNIEENPEILYKLPASDTMQSTGNIFDPNYYAVDSVHGIVYRKEQFSKDDDLPSEYVIRDRRYTMDEIVNLVEGAGFEVKLSRYVQTGKWHEPLPNLDPRAKEILIVAEKRFNRA